MQVRTNLLKELEREFLPAGVAPPPAKKEIPWKRRPSPARSFLILISSIVIGVGLFSFYFYPKGNTTAARFLGLGIPVETVTVQGETFMEIIGAGGKTESAAVMEIRSWVGGKVLLVPVEVGTVVPKDHILAQLDPAPYEAALKLAQAKFTEDKTSFEKSELFEKRMNALFARRLISNIERERATRELNTARVHFSNAAEVFLRAQDNLDHVVIAAQAPGVILERKIEPGDVVNPKEILFLLGSTESVQVV
ncbi:MAG: biotin/lipoyl-binding protein, partial [Nitrospirae bacterium]|nr:biotin/lipoyl-binding protein [Candidatus Troglogloeales bacterium]